MKNLFLTLAALALSACSTPADLKRNNPEAAVFTVNAGYQTVLKRIVDQHRECDMVPILPIGQAINDVQNYTDLRTAIITRGASGVGTQTHQVIEITETAPGKTEVKLFQRFRVAHWGKVYERWANGGTGCD